MVPEITETNPADPIPLQGTVQDTSVERIKGINFVNDVGIQKTLWPLASLLTQASSTNQDNGKTLSHPAHQMWPFVAKDALST